MELRQLRSFIVLARELHFGRAAVRLNMTQPPLSRQMQQLEEELRVQLFSRTSRVVQLTPAGQAFLVEAQKLMQQSEQAIQAARRAAQAHFGEVNVGVIGAATYSFLPSLLVRARTELPNIVMHFKEMMSTAQMEALSLGRIDVGIVRPMLGQEPFQSACVMRENTALALPIGHPLAARRRPQLAQINEEPFIMYSPEASYFGSLLTSAFQKAGVRPRYVQFMTNAQAILAMVSTGLGIAIVPEETKNACFDNVVLRPINLGNNLTADLYAIWRGDNRNPALSAVVELIQRLGNDETPTLIVPQAFQ